MKDGAEHQGGIEFYWVTAMRKRNERCCKVWHIDGVFDTLMEIEDSPWADEIRSDTQELWRDKWAMHHYMIYLDSVGCFEVIADSLESFLNNLIQLRFHRGNVSSKFL
jgi:hypothetical protein